MKTGVAHCQHLPSRLLMRQAPSLQSCRGASAMTNFDSRALRRRSKLMPRRS